MAQAPALDGADIEQYFRKPARDGLRIIVCGRAEDGAGNVIERLLPLSAGHRKLTLAGTARHEQDTRDIVAAASSSDVAIIVVDARAGLLPGTRHHAYLASLLGVRNLVLAVGNTERADHSAEAFGRVEAAYREFARRIGLADIVAIPIRASGGESIAGDHGVMRWYRGPSLMEHLETVPIDAEPANAVAVDAADQFEATIVWMGDAPMLPGRNYAMKLGSQTATATIAPLKYRVDANTLEHLAATKLEPNEIGVCQLELDRPVTFAPYAKSRELGGFILVDRLTRRTVGAGTVQFALRRAQNVHWQALDIDRAARARIKAQKPCVLWFTGISASGKSTIANLVEKKLHAMGRHTYLLDGDNIRHGLNKDLGFTEAARVENIRRVAEVAALMADAGLIVLAAFISPFRSERRMARGLLPAGQFLEVFVDTSLQVAEARDPKGLYKKARRGELKNFTGIDSPYEPPEGAEIRIDGAAMSPEQAAQLIVEEMRRRGL